MCYTGKCPYENYMGDCVLSNLNNETFFRNFLKTGLNPLCSIPDSLLKCSGERILDTMKILNKNKKLKYSKMLIDYDTYEKICNKYGTTIEDHIKAIEAYQSNPDNMPNMSDINIVLDVYTAITKVIRKRR